MISEPLDFIPIGWLFVLTCAASGLAIEAGYRFGRRRRARLADENDGPVGTIVGSVLALLAFLLTFTVGLAASRYESRRQVLLEEANAIGTTYLRTRLLPEPQGRESARLLREYVEVRVAGVRDRKIAQLVTRSEELHELLWAEAVESARRQPNNITGLYIASLNEVIDVHAERVHAGTRNRIPANLWFGVYALAFLAMASVGYQSGLVATRRSPMLVGLVLAFAGVIFMIADLDRPNEGFLTVGQQAMYDLQASMKTEKR